MKEMKYLGVIENVKVFFYYNIMVIPEHLIVNLRPKQFVMFTTYQIWQQTLATSKYF